ncbi:MAG TPA: hypothetical protein VNT75_18870 [Symbiobacteriaceae bacterium]|nr:hypothetical protein [Symbiobacteriaceae bacterium]
MEEKERQRLAEQRATNAQTVTFVANQEADIVTAAEERAESNPAWNAVAAAERERVDLLLTVAAEESELATALNTGTADEDDVAAEERAIAGALRAVSQAEGQIAAELKALEREDDYGPVLLAEQAEWNRDLLRHVAQTASQAERTLREDQGTP